MFVCSRCCRRSRGIFGVSALTRCRALWCTGHQGNRSAGVCGGLSRQLHWSEVVLLVEILYRMYVRLRSPPCISIPVANGMIVAWPNSHPARQCSCSRRLRRSGHFEEGWVLPLGYKECGIHAFNVNASLKTSLNALLKTSLNAALINAAFTHFTMAIASLNAALINAEFTHFTMSQFS